MYTVKQVVAMTGLAASTLRVWERRYGVVTPRRTSGHYRMFSEADVARLRAMVQLIEAGATAGAAADIVMNDVAGEAAPPRPEGHPSDPTLLADLAADVDIPAISQLLGQQVTSADFETSVDAWLTPAVAELERRQGSGTLTSTQAVAAQHAVERHLGTLLDAVPPLGEVAPLVLVGVCESGGPQLAALAFTCSLRLRGVDARYLGAGIGHGAWLRTARQLGPRAVALSVSSSAGTEEGIDVAEDLAALKPPVTVWLGGVGGVWEGRPVRGRLPLDLERSTRTVMAHLRAGAGARTGAEAGQAGDDPDQRRDAGEDAGASGPDQITGTDGDAGAAG